MYVQALTEGTRQFGAATAQWRWGVFARQLCMGWHHQSTNLLEICIFFCKTSVKQDLQHSGADHGTDYCD